MKAMMRSSAAKIVAFVGVLVCLALTAQTVTSTLQQLVTADGLRYDFAARFEQSSCVAQLLGEQMGNLYQNAVRWEDAVTAVQQDTATYGGEQEDEPVPTLRTDLTQRELDISMQSFTGDYLMRLGGKTYTNLPANSPDRTDDTVFIQNARAFQVLRQDGMESNGQLWWYNDLQALTFGAEDFIAVRLTEEQAAPLEAQWSAGANTTANGIRSVTLYSALGLLGILYLIFVTGRRGEEEQIYLITIDRLYVELNALLLVGVGALGVIAYVGILGTILEGRMYGEADYSPLYLPALALLLVCAALALELLLSLVRNLKNRSFVQRSFVLRACLWCGRTAKRLLLWCGRTCKRLWHVLGSAKRSLWNGIFQNYRTRNVVLLFTGYSALLAFLAFLFGLMHYGGYLLLFLLGVAWFAAACVFLVRRIGGFEKLAAGLKRLRAGELDFKIEALPAGVLAGMAEDVNSIGDGLHAALQTEVRAERMKSELITNVSHDLKTPLTSIINYADLLCQQKLTPDEANDYAKIIYQKSNRLKNLTSDLFDISKVQAGAEIIENERLDACTLVRQALAEQQAAIDGSGLTLRTEIPESEVPIRADGKKMSRVLENLIGNCLKYAMPGTRVYLTVAEQDGSAVIELKNIANYEMDFDAAEITERFVRGDAARSTEGSGLGLAIAKSYVAACGGTFAVEVDGDLFKVRIRFPLYR